MDETSRRRAATQIEAVLWIVLGILAFLAKDNPGLVYPQALYLFLLLLATSLATSLTVRLAPEKRWLHALALLGSFASITSIQEWSGGPESRLWTLYLLPVFTAAILLEGRQTLWTAAGACASNAALYLVHAGGWSASDSFELALKTGILASAAGATWLLSRAEREADSRARRQRKVISRLEESVRAAAEARERERGLTEIAAGGAGAAHDMATPLMVVRGFAKMHLERGVGDPELASDLARIDSAAAFCQDLVAGLLARAGGPAGPRRLDAVVETALALAEPILRSRHVEVVRDYPEDSPTVASAPNVLERVVLNLLGNAAKAMPAGGRIVVRISGDGSGDRPSALVSVEDSGPGIPPEILPRLFKPFATTRADSGGTGLGLYVSRETARRCGGDLHAENRPKGGASFTLRLPLHDAGRPAAPARPVVAEPAGQRPRLDK